MWNDAQSFLTEPFKPKGRALRHTPVKKTLKPRFLAKRRDAPLILPTAGPKKRITGERVSASDKVALLGDLEEHKYASSSRPGMATHLRTWSKLHRKWFGSWAPVLPLTPEKIRAVASQMRQRRYRSFPNYMSTVRRWHIKRGQVWDQVLALEATDSARSCKRGIGPAKQAATFAGGQRR